MAVDCDHGDVCETLVGGPVNDVLIQEFRLGGIRPRCMATGGGAKLFTLKTGVGMPEVAWRGRKHKRKRVVKATRDLCRHGLWGG